MNAPNKTRNVQRTLLTPSSSNTSTVRCYNCSGKGHYARNFPKPRMKEIEEHSANNLICQNLPADHTFDDGPSYEFAFISEEADKQQIFAQQVQKQNTHLTSQLEMYKERVRILESINKDNNYLNEFLEADERAKCYNKQAQSQLVRDRDIIRDLKKQRDKLDLDVKNYKRKNEELQKTHSILKRQMSEKEDTYHDTILDLEAKLKKNVDLILKLGNSLQGMFMLGPKPLSILGNLEIPLNVRDSEDTLEDAFKSQQKMNEKMNDPILSGEQKYFSSSSIPSAKIPVSKDMPSDSPLIKELDKIKDKILNAELEKVKKKSFEIQEDLLARIKILENDVQRCEKQSVDFQLKLQHEREKQKWDSTLKNKNTIPLDYSWISKTEKLEDENVSLDFTVQSLIKERDNAKIKYKKLFDSIK
ncbi:hypothetical protein Tco_1506190 [Tanacetum coccineum]